LLEKKSNDELREIRNSSEKFIKSLM